MKKGHRLSDGDLSFWASNPVFDLPMRIDGEVFALELHGVEESILRLETGIIDVLQRNTSIGATMAMSGTAIIGMFFSEFVRNAALDLIGP